MRFLICAAWLVATGCGNKSNETHGGDPPPTPKPGVGSSATKPGPGSSEVTKPSASGSVTLTGELAGTFQWKDDLALDTCGWFGNVNAGLVELTMTDGADAFISLRVSTLPDRSSVHVSSAKLPSGNFEQKTDGVNLTSLDDGKLITAQVDAITASGDKTVKIKGTLKVSCNQNGPMTFSK